MPARVAAAAVEGSVSIVYRHRQGLHSLGLVGLLLQQDRASGGWAVGSWAVWSWAVGSHWSYWSYWSDWRYWSWVKHVSHVGHVGHGPHLRVVFRVQLEGGDEARVVLTHVVCQQVVLQFGGHRGHHLLHLNTFWVSQAGRVNHVQLCSQVGRLWHFASLGWFYILTVNFLRQGISLVPCALFS